MTQTVPDISPLMRMHQDPLLVWISDAPGYWLISASLDLDELIIMCFRKLGFSQKFVATYISAASTTIFLKQTASMTSLPTSMLKLVRPIANTMKLYIPQGLVSDINYLNLGSWELIASHVYLLDVTTHACRKFKSRIGMRYYIHNIFRMG